METYSALISLKKAIKYPIIVFIAIAITGFVGIYPEWAQMTLGGLLILFYDWLKNKWEIRLP